MAAARRKTPYRILLPLANPRTARDLVRIGAGVADGRPTEITVLGIVEVPEGVSLSEGATQARTSRRLLQRVLDVGDEEGVELRTMVRIGRHAADGVIEAVGEEGSDLVIFGWGGPPTPSQTARADAEATELVLAGQRAQPRPVFSPTIDAVVRESPCDIAVVKQRGLEKVESILVPVRGGPHAELAMRISRDLGQALRRQGRRPARRAEGDRRSSHRARAGRRRCLRARARGHPTGERPDPRGIVRPAGDHQGSGQPPAGGDGRIGASDECQPRRAIPVRHPGGSGRQQGQADGHRRQDEAVGRSRHLRRAARQRGHAGPRRCLRGAQPVAARGRRQVVRREHLPRPRVRRHQEAARPEGTARA